MITVTELIQNTIQSFFNLYNSALEYLGPNLTQ